MDHQWRVVVTGSRTWGVIGEERGGSPPHIALPERAVLQAALNAVLSDHPDMVLAEGEARGADFTAKVWAKNHGVPVERYPADWDALGKGAGSFRNAQMITDARADLILAFWGRDTKDPTRLSRGTRNMIVMCRRRGIPTLVYRTPFWFDNEVEMPAQTSAPTGLSAYAE